MIRKLLLPLAIVAIGLGFVAVVTVTRPQPEPDSEALSANEQIEVPVRRAKRQPVSLSASGQGTVLPKREIDLVAEVSGKVVGVGPGIDDGAFFDNGALLIEIDKRDYEVAHSVALARVATAQRALAEEMGRARQAQREWRDLGNERANDLFLRKPQLIEARANLDAAQADLELAQINLDRTEITAPFEGRVSKLHVDLGQYVPTGSPVAAIYDTSAAEVRIPLTDRQLAILALPLGRNSSQGPRVRLSAEVGGELHYWEGVITRTDATVDTNSRMYYAIAEIRHPFGTAEDVADVPLMPGLFVTAEISGRTIDDVMVLPRETLVRRHFIYTLSSDNKIVLNNVDVLKKNNAFAWFRSDIEEGTPIVLQKHALLSEGAEVSPLFEDESASSNAQQALEGSL